MSLNIDRGSDEMVRGLYTAHTGLRNEQRRLDIISNNLANSATTGFKEERATNQAFSELLTIKIRDGSEAYNDRAIGHMSLGVRTGEVYTDYNQGSLRQTENPYDLAISGEGFFSVMTTDRNGNQELRYTRDGYFKLTTEGFLTDVDGNRLQGLSGDVQIPVNARDVSIDRMGFITADGQVLDRITLVDFEDYDYLEKMGNTMYRPVEGWYV